MRRAHWHHYWVGKGRTELILKWIEPVFVGSGEVSAVKHRVEQEREAEKLCKWVDTKYDTTHNSNRRIGECQMLQKEEAAIIPLGNQDVIQSQYQSMSQSKKFMWKW